MERALLYLYPGCVYREVADAIDALSEDFALDVAAAEPGCVAVAEGIEIRATVSRTDAADRSYTVVVIPGGDIEEPLSDTDGLRALGDIGRRDGVVVAGICNGVVVLGAAGLLDGRRVTHTVRPPGATPAHIEVLGPFVSAATYVDEDVVVDGTLITAKPWANADFARAIVAVLSAANGNAEKSGNA